MVPKFVKASFAATINNGLTQAAASALTWQQVADLYRREETLTTAERRALLVAIPRLSNADFAALEEAVGHDENNDFSSFTDADLEQIVRDGYAALGLSFDEVWRITTNGT